MPSCNNAEQRHVASMISEGAHLRQSPLKYEVKDTAGNIRGEASYIKSIRRKWKWPDQEG